MKRPQTKLRTLTVAVSACFAASALALPTGPVVVNGSASLNQAGNVLSVTNSNGAILNWQKFGIAANEAVRFNQSSASSSVLNRVVGPDPSQIFGQLTSNGRVWLINPAGILVGPGGRIDTAGFVASTLNVANQDFLAGKLNFQATPGTGSVVNQGSIVTPAGGSVYLVGANVSNEGVINTPNGETILAAGQTVNLIDTATPGVKVEITGAAGNVTNLGEIAATAGRIGMGGVIVRNSGMLNASSVVNEGGRIFLKASQDTYVDGAGRIVATGTKGGQVEVLGHRVAVMDNASIDASGANGGGSVLVGGDTQGKNADVQNATITYFGPQASLKANAIDYGDGGKVVVWSDDTTRAYGSISARGGATGGNGGFVETSGHRYLDANGIHMIDTRAPMGKTGNWLLDPNDVTIVHSLNATPDSNISGNPFAPVADTANSTLSDFTINSILSGTSVQVSTASTGTAGSGDIKFNDDTVAIAFTGSTSGATLKLNADHDIVLRGSVTNNSAIGTRTLELNAGNSVQTPVSANFSLVGNGGNDMIAQIDNGKTWDNYGTINLTGNSQIKLFDGTSYATFNNRSTGQLNSTSTANWIFTSSNSTDLGVVNNYGGMAINALGATSIEGIFNQTSTGSVTLGGDGTTALSLQNAQSIAGSINMPTLGQKITVSENHGATAGFSGTTFTGSGSLVVGTGSAGTPAANFTNVSASTTSLVLGGNALGGTVSVLNGGATFKDITTNTNGLLSAINNGTLTVSSVSGYTVPTGVTYTGNVNYAAPNGTLTVAVPILSSAGSVGLSGSTVSLNSVLTAYAGSIAIKSDTLTLGGSAALHAGTIAIMPLSDTRDMFIGTASPANSLLLNANTAPLDASSGWKFGSDSSTYSGTTKLGNDLGAPNGLSLAIYGGTGTTTGNILVSGAQVSVGTSYLNTGNLTMVAGNNITFDATPGTNAAASVTGSGSQTITANGGTLLLTGGTAKFARLSVEQGAQTISGKSVTLQAGTGYGGFATIESCYGSGCLTSPWIGTGSNTQTINITGTGGALSLYGGGTAGVADSQNFASIRQANNAGSQIVNVYGGGSIYIQGGQGAGWSSVCNGAPCSNNSAGIMNKGTGGQSVNFFAGGSSITIYGGYSSAYGGNDAGIQSDYGSQLIGSATNRPSIALYGGSSGGLNGTENGADIGARLPAGTETQTVYASSIYLKGGGAVATDYGGAHIGSPKPYIDASGQITLTGGTGYSPALIGYDGAANVVIYGGALTLTGGSDAHSPAGIGTWGAYGAAINIQLQNALFLASNIGAAAIGNRVSGASGAGTTADYIKITTGKSGANGALDLNTGTLQTAGTVTLDAQSSAGAITGGNINAALINATATNAIALSSSGGSMTLGNVASSTAGITVSNAASSSGDISLGTLSGTSVQITAHDKILDTNGSGTVNITSPNISLVSQYGATVGTLAISTDISQSGTGGVVSAIVDPSSTYGATYGGISVRNVSTSSWTPTTLTFTDNATNRTGGLIGTVANGIQLKHAGDLTLSATNFAPTSANNVLLDVAGTLSIQPARYVSSTADAYVGAGSVDIYGGTIHAAGNAYVKTAGDIRLNATATLSGNINAYQDVYLTLNGPASTLYLNDISGRPHSSYVVANLVTTVHLNYTQNPSPSIVIDGNSMPAGSTYYGASTGSGLFVVNTGSTNALGSASSSLVLTTYTAPSGGGASQPPTLSACATNPTLAGCSSVLPTLGVCLTDPTAAGCAAVLPTLAACATNPTATGCSAVLPTLAVCAINPTAAGCSTILPPLSACLTNPTAAGCSAVLPTLAACTTNPAAAGCSTILPTLASCTTNPTAAGCAAVLPPLATCAAAPTLAGCSSVLPTLASCTTNPTAAGCTAVLPTLASCATNPTAAGCSAVLPTIASCSTNPTQEGCATVLPTTTTTTKQVAAAVETATTTKPATTAPPANVPPPPVTGGSGSAPQFGSGTVGGGAGQFGGAEIASSGSDTSSGMSSGGSSGGSASGSSSSSGGSSGGSASDSGGSSGSGGSAASDSSGGSASDSGGSSGSGEGSKSASGDKDGKKSSKSSGSGGKKDDKPSGKKSLAKCSA